MSITLNAVGDIWLSTNDDTNPFLKVLPELQNADIVFANLETAITTHTQTKKKAHPLYISPEKAQHILDAHFSIVNIANNHILDCGSAGYEDTVRFLQTNHILYVGNKKNNENYEILTIRNKKFAFIGYADVHSSKYINVLNAEKICSDITEAKEKADYVILSLHWGTELTDYPSPNQIKMAHQFIDAGVSVILGHHPHVIQGIEMYKKGLIIYSLGNFQFFKIGDYINTQNSEIVKITFPESDETMDNSQIEYSIIPCCINSNTCPYILEGSSGDALIQNIEILSQPIITYEITSSWWYEQIAHIHLAESMDSYKLRIKRHGLMPLLECFLWMILPFQINCYCGLIRRKIRRDK